MMSKEMRYTLVGIGILLVVLYAAGSGFWVSSGDAWYRSLKAPSWQPPDWVFGTIWPYNFIMLGIASTLVALRLPRVITIVYLVFFAASIFSALLWSYLFYSVHDLATSVLALAMAAILTFPVVVIAWRASKVLGGLLIPYQLWLIVATTLSIGYALNN